MGSVDVAPPAPALPVPAPASPAAPVPSPEDFESVRNPHRGDTPMMARWHRLGWSAVLAAAFLAAPAQAPAEERLTDTLAQQETLRQIKELKEALLQELQALRTEARTNQTATENRIRQLDDRLRRLEDRVDGLRAAPTGSGIQQARGINPPTPDTGRVRMRNLFSAPVEIRLNGTIHRLDPGETNEVCTPLGEFTYEVLGIQAPRTDVLTQDKAYNIVVYTIR
jgi:hypothetical protein